MSLGFLPKHPMPPDDSAGGLGPLQFCPPHRVPAAEEGRGGVAGEAWGWGTGPRVHEWAGRELSMCTQIISPTPHTGGGGLTPDVGERSVKWGEMRQGTR